MPRRPTPGIRFAAEWQAGLAVCAIWLLVAFTTKYSSLAALIAAAAAPVIVFFMDDYWVTAVTILAIAVLIVWRHRANIQRLLNGTEPKIGVKQEAAAEPSPSPSQSAAAQPPKATEPLPEVPLPKSTFARPDDKSSGGGP